jgi:cell division septum initiation protein DivIVA
MPDASQKPHPHELQSDLDLLIEMAKEPKRDEEAIRRHVHSLKEKLDHFTHREGTRSGDGSAG